MANKPIMKSVFGVPSLETANRIDDADKTARFQAAHYRLTAPCGSSNANSRRKLQSFARHSWQRSRKLAAHRRRTKPAAADDHIDALLAFGLMLATGATTRSWRALSQTA